MGSTLFNVQEALTVTQNAREATQNVDHQKRVSCTENTIETSLNEATMWNPVSELRNHYVRKTEKKKKT